MKKIKKIVLGFLVMAGLVGGLGLSLSNIVFATTPVKALVVADSSVPSTGGTSLGFYVSFIDPSINQVVAQTGDNLIFGTDLTTYTPAELMSVLQSKVTAFATGFGYTLAASDINFLFPSPFLNTEIPSIKAAAQAKSFNNVASHSIVTTAAAANGWQLSSTRDASVFYSVNVNTTATIAGNADGYIVLEVAATNSTTASDWKEVSRTRNGQALSLALTLQSVQNIGGELMNIVPAGYYARLRSVNVSGTPTYTYVSGQEVLL